MMLQLLRPSFEPGYLGRTMPTDKYVVQILPPVPPQPFPLALELPLGQYTLLGQQHCRVALTSRGSPLERRRCHASNSITR
jgi:hypothetical protein